MHLVILGVVEDDELPSLVAAAEVFAFPSTKEGFGLAAMESALRDTSDGAAGRALALSMTWDAAAAAHLEFYRSHPMPSSRPG